MKSVRRLTLILSCAAAVAHPPPADAQTTTGTTATDAAIFTKDDFLLRIWQLDSKKVPQPLSATEQMYFFNRARCECDVPLEITVEYTASGQVKKNQLTQEGTAQLYLGETNCLAADPTTLTNARCAPLGTVIPLTNLGRDRVRISTTVKALFTTRGGNATTDTTTGKECVSEFVQKIWLGVYATRKSTPDLTADTAPQLPFNLDGRAPSAPTAIQATPGNEALQVSWKAVTGVPDLLGYLVFCSRGDKLPVFKPSYYKDQFRSQASQCGPSSTVGKTAADAGTTDAVAAADNGAVDAANAVPTPDAAARDRDAAAGTSTSVATDAEIAPGDAGASGFNDISRGTLLIAPDPFKALNPDFLCSGLLTAQTNARIYTLQNDIPYLMGVSAVDKRGNASPITEVVLQRPVPSRDFYRAYRAEGGSAAGGYCSIGAGGGCSRYLGSLLGACVAGLLWRRRRTPKARR